MEVLIIILVVILIIIVGFFIAMYNSLIALKKNAEKAWYGIYVIAK